mgnify:CR=1 FL=1
MDGIDKVLILITAVLAIVCTATCLYQTSQMNQKELNAHVIVMYTSAEQAYTKFDKPCEWYDPEMYTE